MTSMTSTNQRIGPGPVQITSEEIAARVSELARKIEQDYAGKEIHFICVLNGSVHFFSDLTRAVQLTSTIDFMRVSSYGDELVSSANVQIIHDLQHDIEGREVLVVEDIVDTGHTLAKLLEMLQGRKPASLAVVSLLSKPSRRKSEINIDYLGFTIPDAYVYGYGLDVAQAHRNLPFVSSMAD